jgi:hypothetical protein
MTSESAESRPGQGAPSWAQALTDLEESLQDAGRAVAALRRGLESIGFNLSTGNELLELERATDAAPKRLPARAKESEAPTSIDREVRAVAPKVPPNGDVPDEAPKGASFDRLWDKIERERTERAQTPAEPVDERRGLDLLPQHYLMTVEDREGRVSLVPLHRGLQGLPGIEEVTLVSYANGVPVISLRTKDTLDLDVLGEAVGRVMDRNCEVIQQDTGKLYLRMKSKSREAGG